MKIMSMASSRHVKERYLLTLENGDLIKVDLNLIAEFDLYSGRELTEEELTRLRAASERAMAKAKALRIMGSRNMSRQQITRRLVEKGEDPAVADETADWLERVGAVDDAQYAGMIVRHYSGQGYGEQRIRDELYKRGIPRELWEEALAELPDMDGQAFDILHRRLGDTATRKEAKKAAEALVRRGYSWEQARLALSTYEREVGCAPEEEEYGE